MIKMNTTRNMTFENATRRISILYQSSTPSPTVYAVMAAVLSIVLLLGLLENFAVLYTFAINKTVRTKDNMLIAGLAISDIGQSVFGVPFVVLAAIFRQWIFGNFMCQYYGFITTSLGLSQITLLTFIAIERYFINIRHVRKFTITKYKCRCVVVFCFLYGFAWGTGPVLGWSSYKLEATGIACSVSWGDRTLSSISFTVSLFVFGWFLPLILIAFGYMNIALLVMKERIRRKRLQHGTTHRLNWEKRVSMTILMMIGAFILSWFPYSAISLWSTFNDTRSIPVWLQVAPALFAKSSIIWNPIIYVCRNGNFRQAVFNSMSCFIIDKPQTGNTDELPRTKITDNETTSIHNDIKSKLNKIKSETTKAFKKERMYDFKNKKIMLKIKETSEPSNSMISRTNQETSSEVLESHCSKTKYSSQNRRNSKFSVFQKRGLLEKIPEYESDNLVQRYRYERTEMLSYIRKYNSSWRQSNKLAEKQTQTDEFSWCHEGTMTAEKGLQTDKANWTKVQKLGKLTSEINGVELSKNFSLNQTVLKQCVSAANCFSDSQVSKKRKFKIDPPDKNIIQTSYDTKRQYMNDLHQPQSGKSKSTTALETMKPFGSSNQDGDCKFSQKFLDSNKVGNQERKNRYKPNVREFNSDIYNDTIANFNFADEKVEIIHAWRDFDDLQNETDIIKVCQDVEESSHPERKIKHFQKDTYISARAWRVSNDFDSNIPLLRDNCSNRICSDIF